jgi:hypothetical protein
VLKEADVTYEGLLLIVVERSDIRECEEEVFHSILGSIVEEFKECNFIKV